jgi:hypothetical protein
LRNEPKYNIMPHECLFLIFPGRFFPAKVNGMTFEVQFEVRIVFDEFGDTTQRAIQGILHAIGVFGKAGGFDIKNQRHMKAAIAITSGLGGHHNTPLTHTHLLAKFTPMGAVRGDDLPKLGTVIGFKEMRQFVDNDVFDTWQWLMDQRQRKSQMGSARVATAPTAAHIADLPCRHCSLHGVVPL